MKTPRKRVRNPQIPYQPWSQKVDALPVVDLPGPTPKGKVKPPLESVIERKVCDYAKSKGCYTRKYTSPAHRGVPDRIIIAPGGAVGFLELKRPGNKPTPLQLKEMATLRQVGCTVEWVDNVTDGKLFVDRLIEMGKGDDWL